MLVEFSVKNFMSFKDKVTFSMEAAIGTENEENIINVSDVIIVNLTQRLKTFDDFIELREQDNFYY